MNLYLLIGIALMAVAVIVFILYLVLGKAAGQKLKNELKEEY